MPTFNIEAFRSEIAKQVSTNPKIIDTVYQIANEKFISEKEKLLTEFNESPVTKEIEGGPRADNISNTIRILFKSKNDYLPGNLFSFIGFEDGSDPIKDLRKLIQEQTYLKKTSRGAIYSTDKITYKFDIYYPTTGQIEDKAPMPWSIRRSWVRAISKGLDNISHYLYVKSKTFEKSRSGPGLQIKKESGRRIYTPPKDGYLLEMVERFLNKFKK